MITSKILYQYKHARKKYTNYELLKKVTKKVYEKSFHSIKGKIIIKYPINLNENMFEDFVPTCKFFFNPEDREKYLFYLNEFALKDEVITQARDICQHKFNILGSGKTFLGDKINWHKDFKSGFVWPKKYYKNITTVDLSNDADVKIPWELSRFQHIPTLGQAYWLTNDEKFAIEYRDQIENWIDENPIAIGVNWTCTMDVSIRAVNWIIGYYYFKDSKSLSSSFWKRYFKNLYLTGKFINENLENYINGHGNNHYLSNLVGLVWLGLFFNNFNNRTIKWLDKGIKEVIKEMKYQVNPEGTNFEASIPYHRLVTEFFLSTTILAEKNNISFPSDYKERLERMCEFIMYYTKNNGLAPQVGDADDGRLHIFTHYGTENKRDHRHILGIGGEYFHRDDFRYFSSMEIMDAIWLIGDFKKTEYQDQGKLQIKAYNEMGYYIIKDKGFYLLIRCGNVGQDGIGGHAHNDQLSFDLQINGKDIFIDPGTYVYTSDFKERNRYRSTANHNTLQVQEEEQNLIEEKQLFRLFDRTNSRVTTFQQTSKEVIFIGEHQGFMTKYGIVHKREITYDFINRRLSIIDTINKPIESKLNWILSSDLPFTQLDEKRLLLNKSINVFFGNKIDLKVSNVSPHYGEQVKSTKVIVKMEKSNTTIIDF